MAFALLAALSSARAADPAVVSGYPIAPIRIGATSLDLGFDVDGQPAQVALTVTGQSAGGAVFASLRNVILDRDQASAVAFHALVPLSSPFPADGQLTVVAAPISAGGTRGAETSFT